MNYEGTKMDVYLNNINYFKNTTLSNTDIKMAKKIINEGFMQELIIDNKGIVSGLFFNECCCIKKNKDKYELDKNNLRVLRFEEQDIEFNLKNKDIKNFKCHKKGFTNKCMYETCPYFIALKTLMDCNSLPIKNNYVKKEPINPVELKTNKVKKINISEIGNKVIEDKLTIIKNRIPLLLKNKNLDILPQIYLITGDNKLLKSKSIKVLKQILEQLSGNITNIDLLTNDNYSIINETSIIFNYDKLNSQMKELFINNLYKLELNKGVIIIDTTTDSGLELIGMLDSKCIDVKKLHLVIPDYNNKELQSLFFKELEELDIEIDDSVYKLFDNGYFDKYILKHSNIKNKQLIDNLLITICDNITQNDLKIITKDDFPNFLDKTKQQESIDYKLSKLIGLHSVKKQLNELMHYLTFIKKMDNKINMPILNLHAVFSGSPGTGKTTIARIYANMLYELGYIKEYKLIEVSRGDLIAEYVGQTAIKTKNVFDKAMGGVLFIDEAYSLTPTNGNGFESECISTIIKLMEDRRDDIVVIFAGYEDDMGKFLDANEGLRSRVNNHILFNDYSVDELYQIFENSIIELNLKLDISIKPNIIKLIEMAKKDNRFGNGRYIMNLRQKILMNHAVNTSLSENETELITIVKDDLF